MTTTSGEPSEITLPDGSPPPLQGVVTVPATAPDTPTALAVPVPTKTSGRRRKALCIGVSRFAPHPDYGLEGEGPDPLPFAKSRVTELSRALEHEAFGYSCTTLTSTVESPGPTAAEIGAAFTEALTEASADDVLIVHVLSHGVPRTTGLYALGSESGHLPQTAVAGWLAAVEDFPDRPAVLFLLDLCHAGQAARLDWQLRGLDGSNRAWVLAAAAGTELAVDGRFTRAVTEVLDALARKRVQYDHGRRHIDFTWFCDQVRHRVNRLAGDHGGLRQRVTSSALDTAAPELPFLPNPCYDAGPLHQVRSGLNAELGGEVGSFLDEVADLAHFERHAKGGSGFPAISRGDIGRGLFTGRTTESALLADWLALENASRLCVVTGSPGVGKSTLLGVLVCAAHPVLREPTRPVWEPLGYAIQASGPLAAVHARRRTVREIVGSLARQLGLGPDVSDRDVAPGWTVERLVEALGRTAGPPPVVIIDALDEMRGPQDTVRALFQPLTTAHRPDGGPVCRMLLGTRDEAPFSALLDSARATGDLVDLDDTRPEALETDLRAYIGKLLSAVLPAAEVADPDETPSPVSEFASAAARALASTRGATGPYLLAALYTSYALQEAVRPSLDDPVIARELGSGVPLTLPGILDLSFDQDHAHQLLRPVLAALAFAQGDGMPVDAVSAVARTFAADRVPAGTTEAGQLLDEVRAFLRSVPDRDGTMLHRLLHQSVADELRRRPVPQGVPVTAAAEVQVYEALVDSLRDAPGGRPQWGELDRYLRRHLAQHAVDAGRFDELCKEPEFLVHADPDWLVPELRHADAETARSAASVYRTSAHVHRRTEPEQRRHILALDAVRHEAFTLADRLAEPAAGSGSRMTWRPSWATGTRISAAHAFTIQVPDGRVSALAGATVGGTPLVVTGSRSGRVRVWDTRSGLQLASADPRRGEIHALLCAEVEGTPVLLGAGAGGALMQWELPTLAARPLHLEGHTETVRTIVCGDVVGSWTALTGDESGRLLMWDLQGTVPTSSPLQVPGNPAQLTALVRDANGMDLAVLADEQGTVRFWSLVADEEVGPAIRHPSRVNALVPLTARGVAQIVTAGEDGHVRMWDVRTHEPTARSAIPHDGQVYALTCVSGPEGTRILSGGTDGTIRSWDPEEGGQELSEDNRFVGHMGAVTALAHPDTRVVVSAGSDPVLRVWHVPNGRQRATMPVGHTSWVNALAAVESGDGTLLVSGGADGHIHRWLLGDGSPLGAPVNTASGPIHALVATTLDRRPVLVSGGADGHIHRWHLDDGSRHGNPVNTGTGPIHALVATTLDRRPVLVSAGADGLVRCWDATSGVQRGLPMAGHDGGINALGCADVYGRRIIVSCGDDGTLRCWDLETGLPARAPIQAHSGWVTALACAVVDGRPVAVSGGQDAIVRAWDLADGSAITPPVVVTGGVNAVACGTVGATPMLAAADDCAVRLWDLASGELRESIGVPGTVPALLLRDDQLALGCEWEVVVLCRAPEGNASVSGQPG
nr:hypothetical protein OG296_05080 [Streptomyces sp. NBC_01001]